MPRVHHVKARKDYPQHGIVKGDMCYVWSLKTGPYSSREFRQKTPPKRSQLTTSEFLSSLYDIEDRIAALESLEDIEDIVTDLRQLAEEQDEKFNNMPEGLQQGDTGQRLESRRDGCNEAADELEGIETEYLDDELDNEPVFDDEGYDEYQERRQAWVDERLEEARNVSINYD